LNVRIVSSSSREIEKMVRSGAFREDLFYRLNVVPIHVPSLQECAQDIPALVEHFTADICRFSGLSPRRFSRQALQALEATYWPGNMRQLRNVVEWVLIMNSEKAPDEVVMPEDLPSGYVPSSMNDNSVGAEGEAADLTEFPLKEARQIFEHNYLQAQLRRFRGNVSKTAEYVGMERSALHRKIKSLGLSLNGDSTEDQSGPSLKVVKEGS
jgi:two-component system nitrogen regulation response regulator NtrX